MSNQQQLPFIGLLYYSFKERLNLFQGNLSPDFSKIFCYSIYHNFPNPMTEALSMAFEEARRQEEELVEWLLIILF